MSMSQEKEVLGKNVAATRLGRKHRIWIDLN